MSLRPHILFFHLSLFAFFPTGCSERADVETCERACQNVAGIFAAQASEGDKDLATSLLEEAKDDLSGCTTTCGEQSQRYAECLASAPAQKQLRECRIYVDD